VATKNRLTLTSDRLTSDHASPLNFCLLCIPHVYAERTLRVSARSGPSYCGSSERSTQPSWLSLRARSATRSLRARAGRLGRARQQRRSLRV